MRIFFFFLYFSRIIENKWISTYFYRTKKNEKPLFFPNTIFFSHVKYSQHSCTQDEYIIIIIIILYIPKKINKFGRRLVLFYVPFIVTATKNSICLHTSGGRLAGRPPVRRQQWEKRVGSKLSTSWTAIISVPSAVTIHPVEQLRVDGFISGTDRVGML